MTICKDRGWGKKGKPLLGKKSGKYYQRTNIIAGFVNNKVIAPMVLLIPGQVGVMDNASFHQSEKTKSLIESASCTLIFLPPYSPDLNPIEKFWANMKRWIKHQISRFDTLYDALAAFLNTQTST